VTLRNRVTPFGEIRADPMRGAWVGNRGVLHDASRTIRRDWQVRRWITCRLDFRGRHREVMTPGRWTELFFLDEATAFAAGHRPCGECRNADYRRFRARWETAHPDDAVGADAIDARLHGERLAGRAKRTHAADVRALPDGAFLVEGGEPWLVRGASLLRWTPGGYADRRYRPSHGTVELLTPPGVVAVFRAGYDPQIHPTALDGR
jgi:hypothetical protein